MANAKKATAPMFLMGDKVRLRMDVLARHSRSIPAHAGYTREGFAWRAILDKFKNRVGVIRRVFPSSLQVNVQFRDGTLIGISRTELVGVPKRGKR